MNKKILVSLFFMLSSVPAMAKDCLIDFGSWENVMMIYLTNHRYKVVKDNDDRLNADVGVLIRKTPSTITGYDVFGKALTGEQKVVIDFYVKGKVVSSSPEVPFHLKNYFPEIEKGLTALGCEPSP